MWVHPLLRNDVLEAPNLVTAIQGAADAGCKANCGVQSLPLPVGSQGAVAGDAAPLDERH